MIKPTIGRVVLFNGKSEQRNPAMVCFVHSDTEVNLVVFSETGIPCAKQHVTLIQDGECPIGSCEWMPYQKEQAMAQGQPPVQLAAEARPAAAVLPKVQAGTPPAQSK